MLYLMVTYLPNFFLPSFHYALHTVHTVSSGNLLGFRCSLPGHFCLLQFLALFSLFFIFSIFSTWKFAWSWCISLSLTLQGVLTYWLNQHYWCCMQYFQSLCSITMKFHNICKVHLMVGFHIHVLSKLRKKEYHNTFSVKHTVFTDCLHKTLTFVHIFQTKAPKVQTHFFCFCTLFAIQQHTSCLWGHLSCL